jgi:hypothetical protein
MSKKADLSLNYIFLIFVSVIAVFVIVGMLTSWTFNVNNILNRITEPDDSNIIDTKIITITDNSNKFINNIISHSKMCNERAKNGQVKGELCYAIVCYPDTCTASCNDVKTKIEDFNDEIKVDCDDFQNNNKAIIGFDYSSQKLLIK